jgi:hypothetical protein
VNHNRIGADSDIIADADPAQHLGPGAYVNVVADPGRAFRVASTGVSQGYAVTNQAIIAHHGCSMHDDTTVMFDRKPSADAGARRNSDSKEYFDQFVQNYVNKGPGRANDFISDDEPAVPKAVHEQSPKSEAEQSFTLRTAIFSNDIHAGYCRVSMDDGVRGVRH